MKLDWENIENLNDNEISYLLYLENKTIYQISKIRNLSEDIVKLHIYKIKKDLLLSEAKIADSNILSEYLSLSKPEREQYLECIDKENEKCLLDEFSKTMMDIDNIEDLMVIIWTIGELKTNSFNDKLKFYASHPHGNIRRMTYSAMGKIGSVEFLPYLSNGMKDIKPQVKQYAIIAFGKIADKEYIYKLNEIYTNKNEKEYVRRAAKQSIELILDRNNNER